jgi:hypothetical protein
MSAFVGLIVGRGGADWVERLFDDPEPVQQQIAAIRRQAANDDLHPAAVVRADLRGTGRDSIVMVTRHNSIESTDPNRKFRPISDEVRIYDEVDSGGEHSELRRAFRFRPEPLPGRVPFFFHVQSSSDLDGDGRAELIGGFAQYRMEPIAPHPVVIAWDDRAGRYRIWPLIPERPSLPAVPNGHSYAEALRRLEVPVEPLVDPRSGVRVAGIGSSGFRVIKRGKHLELVAGYVIRQRAHVDRALHEVVGWNLRLTGSRPETFECDPTARPRVRVHGSRDRWDGIFVTAWTRRPATRCE